MKKINRFSVLAIMTFVLLFGFSTLAQVDPQVCEDLREEYRECDPLPDCDDGDRRAIATDLVLHGCWRPFPVLAAP